METNELQKARDRLHRLRKQLLAVYEQYRQPVGPDTLWQMEMFEMILAHLEALEERQKSND